MGWPPDALSYYWTIQRCWTRADRNRWVWQASGHIVRFDLLGNAERRLADVKRCLKNEWTPFVEYLEIHRCIHKGLDSELELLRC